MTKSGTQPPPEIRSEFALLLDFHRRAVLACQHEAAATGARADELRPLRMRELALRNRIVNFQPESTQEALRKVEHFAQILVTGMSVDETALERILGSIARFID